MYILGQLFEIIGIIVGVSSVVWLVLGGIFVLGFICLQMEKVGLFIGHSLVNLIKDLISDLT